METEETDASEEREARDADDIEASVFEGVGVLEDVVPRDIDTVGVVVEGVEEEFSVGRVGVVNDDDDCEDGVISELVVDEPFPAPDR